MNPKCNKKGCLAKTQKLGLYASPEESSVVLRSGAEFRRNRMSAVDMLSTYQAACLVGVSRVTINTWIKQRRCVGIANLRRGFKLPKWQFESHIFIAIKPLFETLDTADGWLLLSFLESEHEALDGNTPLAALCNGEPIERILQLATAYGH